MADGLLPNGEHLSTNEQLPQLPRQPKQSLDQLIAEGRMDHLKEALATEASTAKKELAQLSQAAKTEDDPEAEATNQEVAAFDAEADAQIQDAKKQAEAEIEEVVKPVDVPLTQQAGVVESLEGESVKTEKVDAVAEPTPTEKPSEKSEERAEEKKEEPRVVPESKKEEPQVDEKPKMPDLNPHFEAALNLMADFKQNQFQAGPSELRKLVKLMAAVHPDRFPGVPAVAAFAGLLGRLKMAFGGDAQAWEGYEADFQKMKQEVSGSEAYPSPEEQLRSLEQSAESAKQRMRELYESLMKMKESGGELDQEELAEYIRSLDEDAVLNAFVQKMQSEFRNTKNTDATRARAAQLAEEFARGARAQVAYAEGIVTPKQKPAEAPSAKPPEAEAPKPREASEAEKKKHALEKQVFARLHQMDALVDRILTDKSLNESDRVALRDQLEGMQHENVQDWDELSQSKIEKNEALFDMQQRMTDTLYSLDQYLAENDPGAKALLEKQIQGFRQESALEEPGMRSYFAERDEEFGVSAEAPKKTVEKVDEEAEAQRRMGVMEELLTGKIRKVEAAYDEVLESGDEAQIEACSALLQRLYTERMADLTKDINAYYRKKPGERNEKTEKQVGIWLYEEELLGAQMDANVKKREVADLKRQKQVVDAEVSDLQALIDRSIPTGPNLQLAGAPTVVAGGLARPEMGLAAPMALGEVRAEAKPMSAEEAKKKLEIALSKQVEIAAKIGLASVALGEMYRQMDRIVKARAKDLADLEKMNAESKKKKKEIFLQVGSEAANDNASMTNQDARVEEKEYKIASGEGRGSGGHGAGWFEKAGDVVFMAMHGDEQAISAASRFFDDIKKAA